MVRLAVLQNADDALLVWNVEEEIPSCVGFAVRRELTHDGETHTRWLDNFVGFEGEDHELGERRPSTVWPFQGFSWTDHEISSGDSARYRVVPMVTGEDGVLEQLESSQSEWAEGLEPDGPYRAFFNRGYVMSQFMARYLEETGKSLREFKETIRDEDDRTIRHFLAGDLRVEMLALLERAREDGGEVYAALYELDDEELIEALAELGKRAHVVLANGSITQKKGEDIDVARKRDQNADGRKALLAASVDVEEKDRFISPGALGHNKFLVLADSAGKPKQVWTGSTNWTPTGLCTQLNNGLLVADEKVAEEYLQQWHRLRDAGSKFPPDELVDPNSIAKQPRPDATVWFTKSRMELDLVALREVIAGAQSGLLFLMFRPGKNGVLPDVLDRQQDPNLFVRGVVSELPDPDNEKLVKVTFVDNEKTEKHDLDVIEPDGRPNAVAWWAAEATRGQFTSQVGYAIVHSKVLVVDPLSDNPTVVTGSHNFSEPASDSNDENFLIIRGDRALAEAYTVNVFSAWRHYRARVADGLPWPGLKKDDGWMAGSLRARRAQAGLWGF